MDPLALLCNLHGDGPSTLHRLRRAGCESLAALLELDDAALAALLGWKDARLERFRREAAHLAGRVEDGLLDAEDDDAAGAEPPAPLPARAAAADEAGAQARGGPRDEAPEPAAGHLDAGTRERVLARWRELDSGDVAPLDEVGDTPSGAASGAEEVAESRLAYEAGEDEDAVLVPSPRRGAPGARGTPLACAGIEALDAERLARLAAAGVATLEELASSSDVELASRAGLPVTHVTRLSFLARRALAELATADAGGEAEGDRSGAGAAASDPRESRRLDAGGPFA